MKIPPVEGWEPAKIKHSVTIPTVDGQGIAETVEIDLDVWKDSDGEVYLDSDAREKVEAVKARYLGLLTPAEIKEIRVLRLQTTQKQISRWLQIGEKTWTRWESGRERPSRSMNVILCALRDLRIDADYLEGLRLGRKLNRIWRGESLPSPRHHVIYQTPERADVVIRQWADENSEPEMIAVIETKYSGDRRTAIFADSSFVGHFAKLAKQQLPTQSPWDVSHSKSYPRIIVRRGSKLRVSSSNLLSS